MTAGPTHEPIDAVRYIGNRSSGRLGVAIADEAARLGWRVTLLLGPSSRTPSDSRVELHRFRTAADLQGLLSECGPQADVIVMAAAVADFRPALPAQSTAKLKRSEGLSLTLEPTPDLLASYCHDRPAGQLVVAFALEPRDHLLARARRKLVAKGADLIVANPLETMDAEEIEATVLARPGLPIEIFETPGPVPKPEFAALLLGLISHAIA